MSDTPKYVLIRNEGDRPFKNWLSGSPYTLAPGGQDIVGWDVACGWLGDPTLVDVGQHRQRHQEWMRLRVMYGVYEHENRIPELMPNLSVWSNAHAPEDERVRVAMIIDDPEGSNRPRWTRAAEPRSVDDRLAMLENELASLRAFKEATKGVVGSGTDDGGAGPTTTQPVLTDPGLGGDNTAGLNDLEPDEAPRPRARR